MLLAKAWPMSAMAVLPELPETFAVSDVSNASDATADIEQALRPYIDISKPYAAQRDAVLEAFRKAYVGLLLAHTNGNRSHAARIAQVERSHFTKLANRLGGRRER
jgi:DNA-binding NtrC family response regulator